MGLCGLKTRNMAKKMFGRPKSGIRSAGEMTIRPRRSTRVLNQLTIRSGVIGDGANHCGDAGRSANEEVKRNLPGPRRLLEQWNAVIAGFGRGLREWGAGWTRADYLQLPTPFCLAPYFIEPLFAPGVAHFHVAQS